MKRKSFFAFFIALLLLLPLYACSNKQSNISGTTNPKYDKNDIDKKIESAGAAEAEYTELIVFAAASMTETLTKLGNQYMEENKNIIIIFNFDSSGTLKTQIQEGADVDIFISAGQKQMNQLDITASPEVNPDGNDYVISESRFNLLENKIVLSVPEGNPANINSFSEMVAGLKEENVMLAMGNSDVPVGQYTQKILKYYGLNEEDLVNTGVISYVSNVKELSTQISEAVVDCGIIYQTDAFSAGLAVVDKATEDMCGMVVYPAAVMKASENIDAAQAFLKYLTSAEANAVFISVGFTAAE